ncbi:hypothetical protein NC653_024884 [Populus alba x Populus x berolinensis]|uniref:Uncharacterized protein n=2 Tax=Saliceae TaxID=238069 RepID=A0AAD6Q8D6_9ROSI|nr:hypothetical protein NC653_024884 [Populus alba x Populus x berolinensis]
MSSLGTSKGILEIAKFGVYVTVPVVLMYAFANNTKNLQKFMGNDLVEMEAFEFRLEDKRFPRQQLEMAFIHSVPIKDSKTSITRGDEGKGSRIGSQEGYSLMLTASHHCSLTVFFSVSYQQHICNMRLYALWILFHSLLCLYLLAMFTPISSYPRRLRHSHMMPGPFVYDFNDSQPASIFDLSSRLVNFRAVLECHFQPGGWLVLSALNYEPREKGSASLSVKCLINVSNQVTGSEIRVQVASLRPINAEKTICSCKKANDMVRYPAFSDDKGILGLIYDTLLRARALP